MPLEENMNSFYSAEELLSFGFKSIGNDVSISRKCSIYGAADISIGSHVRIDDFCLLSGHIEIGNRVHISAYAALYGGGGITIGNFCGISPRCTLLSASDDFSGEHMISPMVPPELTYVTRRPIIMEDYTQLGTGTTVLPGVHILRGAVTGACSLVRSDLPEWSVCWGVPCKSRKIRSKKIEELSSLIID